MASRRASSDEWSCDKADKFVEVQLFRELN